MILLLLRSNLFGHAVQIWSHLSRGWGSRQNVEKWTVKIRDNNKTVADATLRTLNNYNKTYMRLKGTLRWIKWCVSRKIQESSNADNNSAPFSSVAPTTSNSITRHENSQDKYLSPTKALQTTLVFCQKKKHIISDTSITAYICILHYVLYYSMYSYITNTK